MIALSLFDGMSCGRIAFERAGIPIEKYYASEIDKYAQIVSAANYPDIIRLGDITKWQEWNIEKPDIIIAGSPCQGFSFAGKGLNFNDERSKLFFTFVEILKHYKPKYFLLENVVMKKEHNDVISSMLGEIYPECVTQKELFRTGRLEPIQINSALVSAQNRVRLYWTNINSITQPEDKRIFLKDIIETGVVEKGISDKNTKYIIDKKGEPDASLYRKSKCFTAGAHSGGTHSDMDLIPIITGGRIVGRKINPETGKRDDYNEALDHEQRIEIKEDYKSNCLSTVEKDNICIQIGEADIKGHDYNKRVYSPEGKSPSLCSASGGNLEPKIIQDNITWRKLTPRECGRLQTVPEDKLNVMLNCGVSKSQLYKCFGNGWTIDVIAHILSFIAVL